MAISQVPKTVDVEYFQSHLLEWYHRNKRSMPWREDPSPYHVWISEIMLQQTRVGAVEEYYVNFVESLPDVKDLAEVEDDVLHKLWEGLGYYNRAKNLKKSAQIIMNDYNGKIPSDYHELLRLSGIGPYTAGAIASIAFHQNVPAVDGNVMRVISRIFAIYESIGKQSTRKMMEDIVQSLIPPKEVQHFNQALMELGALLCIPNGSPHCVNCPLNTLCYAFETKKQGELPVKEAKKKRRIEKRTVFLFMDENKNFFIRKRGNKGLLSGLWEFVSEEGHLGKGDWEKYLKRREISFQNMMKIESSKHIFSHIEWHMEGYLVQVSSKRFAYEKGGLWCDLDALRFKYSIPTAFRVYVNSIEKGKVFKYISS